MKNRKSNQEFSKNPLGLMDDDEPPSFGGEQPISFRDL